MKPSKVALLVSTVILCAYFTEFIVAALLPFRPALAAWRENRPYDFRTYHQVVRDLRREGVEAFPALLPLPFLRIRRQPWPVHPLGGISRVRTVFCNELGEYLVYDSDEHGFHNPPGIWGADDLQLAVVGDSFAQGACVASADNFVSFLRQTYPRTLNLGMGGNGPLTSFVGIAEYLPALRPDAVLWFFYERNDLFDLRAESEVDLLMRYLRDGFRQGLVERQPGIDALLKAFAEESLRLSEPFGPVPDVVTHRYRPNVFPRALRLAHLTWLTQEILDYPYSRRVRRQLSQMELLEEILRSAQHTIRSWDGELYFVVLPGWKLAISADTRQEVVYRGVVETAASLNIPVIDLVPIFRETSDVAELFAYPGSHYNAEGHGLVGQEVVSYLQRSRAKRPAARAARRPSPRPNGAPRP